jgi:hypothetical protein
MHSFTFQFKNFSSKLNFSFSSSSTIIQPNSHRLWKSSQKVFNQALRWQHLRLIEETLESMPTAQMAKTFTREEILVHTKLNDLWIVIHNKGPLFPNPHQLSFALSALCWHPFAQRSLRHIIIWRRASRGAAITARSRRRRCYGNFWGQRSFWARKRTLAAFPYWRAFCSGKSKAIFKYLGEKRTETHRDRRLIRSSKYIGPLSRLFLESTTPRTWRISSLAWPLPWWYRSS